MFLVFYGLAIIIAATMGSIALKCEESFARTYLYGSLTYAGFAAIYLTYGYHTVASMPAIYSSTAALLTAGWDCFATSIVILAIAAAFAYITRRKDKKTATA